MGSATESGRGATFDDLEKRLQVLLPPEYDGRYEQVQPFSMGSAALRYAPDGKVAWDTIWGSFCDLAMAGGPPHRGTLLESASKEQIDAAVERYKAAELEICRGIALVTGLWAEPSPFPGWVQMYCTSAGMAGWLARALVMENVSACFRGLVLYLPAGPNYRIEKEIKNVITAVAKTCHYWLEHTSRDRHWEISRLLAQMEQESPLLQPPSLDRVANSNKQHALNGKVAASLQRMTGLRCSRSENAEWLRVDCGTVRAAVWRMHMLVVSNVLARREETHLLIPINYATDPDGERIVAVVMRVHRFAVERALSEPAE